MIVEAASGRRRADDRSPIENALRFIGGQRGGQLLELLRSAIEWPTGDVGVALRPLIEPTAVLGNWTPDDRAEALESLIKAGVEHSSVGAGEHSRERRVLRAAFRLPDPEIAEHWAATLSDRWTQLKALEQLFPPVSTNTTQPMEAAWGRAVRRLSAYLDRQFMQLGTGADWSRFGQRNGDPQVSRPVGAAIGPDQSELRPPSQYAQPFLMNLLVVTVLFRGRAQARRISERVVTARADGVEFFTARAYSADPTFSRMYVPITALWGCKQDLVPISGADSPMETRLRFPQPLRRGEQAYFASEALFNSSEPSAAGDRDWINVEVDHHGIVAGSLHHNGLVPASGLTIRACFEESYAPVAAWWYAESTEYERAKQPPVGDKHLLSTSRGQISHTFTQVCQPRESYGVGFQWGPD